MKLDDISLLGWLHSAACMIALLTGPLVFALRKGTRRHRKIGTWYAGSMAAANVIALGLYAPIEGLPAFNMFHWMAIATLIFIGLGYWAARNQRTALGAYGHPVMMILSFYMLIGGAINEAFARIGVLRDAALAGSPRAHHYLQTRLLGMSQSSALLLALVMLIWAAVRVARSRARFRLAPAK